MDITVKIMVRRAALDISDDMIAAARTSGPDPIAWVTGNAFYPPLRSYSQAEAIWQLPDDGESVYGPWEMLTDLIDQQLDAAHVALECPEYDNSLYVVDLDRFEFTESAGGEYLQDDWQPRRHCLVCGEPLDSEERLQVAAGDGYLVGRDEYVHACDEPADSHAPRL